MKSKKLEIPADLSVPEFVKRADSDQSKAARAQIVETYRHKNLSPAVDQRDRKGVPPGYAVPADDAGWKLLEETLDRKAAANLKGLERLAHWKEENEMSVAAKKVGPKEARLQEQRATPDKLKEMTKTERKARAKDSFSPEQHAKLEEIRQEHLKAAEKAVEVTASVTPKKKSTKAAKTSAPADAKAEIQSKALKMLQRKDGMTNPDMVETFGKRLHVRVLEKWAKEAGLKFKLVKNEGQPQHYTAHA